MNRFENLNNQLDWNDEANSSMSDALTTKRKELRNTFQPMISLYQEIFLAYYNEVLRNRLKSSSIAKRALEFPQATIGSIYSSEPLYTYVTNVLSSTVGYDSGFSAHRKSETITQPHKGITMFDHNWDPEVMIQMIVTLSHPWDPTIKEYDENVFKARGGIRVWDVLEDNDVEIVLPKPSVSNAWNRNYSSVFWEINREKMEEMEKQLTDVLIAVTPNVLDHQVFWRG